MLTLLDVADLCARMRAVNLDLFETVGGWITDTPPGAEQQRWATVCHRHAWHADLWAERAPKIRPFDLDSAVAARRGRAVAGDDRAAWYDALIAELSGELDEVDVDPVLDPATARTIALVRADLAAA